MTIFDLSDETGIPVTTIIKKFQQNGIFRTKNCYELYRQTINQKYSNDLKVFTNGKISWAKKSTFGKMISEMFSLDKNHSMKKTYDKPYVRTITINIKQDSGEIEQEDSPDEKPAIFEAWRKQSLSDVQDMTEDNGYDFTE
ncbi:hypothetical protein MSI_25390 [Treponema sp. JC4]|uniref:hypothetical protein n=1 Tax=Treponema sp. JC4 TaxID=1124982 RepID=UPI00025B05D0|nr:hypothetical protein [Treponema sp. JC4]EID84032.1 hypothetical protein MSI_25390 [Treponema sp. JC4]